MKKLLIIGLVLTIAHQIPAQTASKITLASTGGHIENNTGVSLSWTLGEPFVNVVMDDEKSHWTEGFQQGELDIRQIHQLEFEATRESDDIVLLEWEAAKSLSSVGFIVQRRLENEKDFLTIGFLQSSEVGEAVNLQFEDENDYTGKSFYRLQYAYGNSQMHSPTRQVKGIELNHQVTIFPNPTVDVIKVEFEGSWNNKTAQIQILNQTGAQVLSKRSVQLENDKQLLINDVNQLSSGTYLIHIEMDNQIVGTYPFVKLTN